MNPCVFCEIVAGRAPADVVQRTERTIAIVPLGPVVDGHALFIPRTHITDTADDPWLSADTVVAASIYAARQGRPFNLITSTGREATQSVFHLHWHYVPRAADDGLMVPWGTAWGENPQDPHRCKGMIAMQQQIDGGILLHPEEASHLKVLLDSAVPREQGGPMDWEGAGRRYAESLLGYHPPCTCVGLQRIEGAKPASGCPIHDPDSAAA